MIKLIGVAILVVVVSSAYAVDIQQRFGSWVVIRASDGVDLIALTANESGSFVGFRCFAESQECVHVLFADTKCEDRGNYPVLVNSDYSSLAMDAICSVNGRNHELVLTQYDSIHKILQEGNDIGFAIPMQSGHFKVVRFSLSGSDKAMNYVEMKTSKLKRGDLYL